MLLVVAVVVVVQIIQIPFELYTFKMNSCIWVAVNGEDIV